jgi:glycosyltransferase involved in cell wall biosynthesis
MRVVVAQKGSREHFLLARSLHRLGWLVELVVDWSAPQSALGRFLVGALPGGLRRRAASAFAPDLPAELVRPLYGLGSLIKAREAAARRSGGSHHGYLKTDSLFARTVARLTLPPHDAFLGYAYASLEMLEKEKSQGRFTVLDQIDAGRIHYRIVREESARWPQYSGERLEIPEEYFERNLAELALADLVIVNSEWTEQALIQQGVAKARIEIVPLAYEMSEGSPPVPKRRDGGKTRVLWLGAVSLGKGVAYLVEAARLLRDEPVEFLVAGPMRVSQRLVADSPPNIRWLGPVPRDGVSDLFAQADVFAVPTLSDGFAITQLEALAHGLPVVVTSHCGRVVQDGVTGYIIPSRDAPALAGALARFTQNPSLAAEMAPRCREAVKSYSMAAHAEKFCSVLEARHEG